MSVTVTPHLNFRGTAREALEFYRSVFGGDLAVVTYADAHSVTDPAEADQVMFGQVTAPTGFSIMAFDVAAARDYDPGVIPFFVVLRAGSDDETTGYWDGLVDGGTTLVPLAPSQWSSLYGMVRDRFGVTWVLSVEPAA
jgi:PhnB protein